MKLVGNEDGIAALKQLHVENSEYLKFLVGEAQSNTDHTAVFKAKDGKHYTLRIDVATGDLDVQPSD